MAIAAWFSEAKFGLTGEEEAERIEGVEVSKYLGRLFGRSYDEFLEVLHNTQKARQVWGRLRNLIRREGSELDVLANFYCTVFQTVLLFGADTWVLLAPMAQRLEGVHVGLL